MKLNEGNYILMGKAKESGELYLKVVDSDNPPRGTAFQLRKIQDYFYINTKALFDTVLTDYEYKKNRISFEITKEEIDGEVYFKMTPIQKKR